MSNRGYRIITSAQQREASKRRFKCLKCEAGGDECFTVYCSRCYGVTKVCSKECGAKFAKKHSDC